MRCSQRRRLGPADMADLVDRQTEVGGDLLIESERIPAVEDDLLDDGPLSVCQILAHVGNVPSHAQEERREIDGGLRC